MYMTPILVIASPISNYEFSSAEELSQIASAIPELVNLKTTS